MRSSAATVEQYLAELPDDRRQTISAVRDVIRRHLPAGLVETMSCGMISYAAPAEKSPKAAGGQSLMMAGLSSGKLGCSLHLMCLYMNEKGQEQLREQFERIGKKLDIGKACIRFNQPEDLPLDAIGDLVANSRPEAFLKMFEASHTREARVARSRKRKAKTMKKALKQLLNSLDKVFEEHEEVGDTMVREAMHEAVYDSFISPKADYKLPDEFGMFSDEGNKLVHKALARFITHPDVLAAAKTLKTPAARLKAFEDVEVESNEGNSYDEYFGSSE